jgi:hypothetical protein
MGMIVLHWTPEGFTILPEPIDLDDSEILSMLLVAVAQIGQQVDMPHEEFLEAVQEGLRSAHQLCASDDG